MTTPLVQLDPPHVDARGVLQPLVERAMQSAVLVTSKKGSVRANHYHRSDWHYCYVLSGLVEYLYRPAGPRGPSGAPEPERVLVRAGEMVFTGPMVEHAMRFLEDTTFLVLGKRPRDQGSYEADLVRVELIQP